MVGEGVERVIINYFKKFCYKIKQKNGTEAWGDAIYNTLVWKQEHLKKKERENSAEEYGRISGAKSLGSWEKHCQMPELRSWSSRAVLIVARMYDCKYR